MKTTVEIPDTLFRAAKSAAARQGITLKRFFTAAIRHALDRENAGSSRDRPWKKAFGGLGQLHRETERINRVIAGEFERIDDHEWR